MKALKLGTMVKESISGLEGMLTHLIFDEEGNFKYVFQPKLLNPKTGLPVPHFHVGPSYVFPLGEGKEIEYDFPLNIIGTSVSDTCTSLSGHAVGLVVHIDGCIHVIIQPPGVLPEDNQPIKKIDLSILRLTGPAIPVLSEQEKDEVRQKTPSPDPVSLDSSHSPGR